MRIYDCSRPTGGAPARVQSPQWCLHVQEWNGRNEQDALVQPGTYIYELTLDSEEQHTQRGVFAVAY